MSDRAEMLPGDSQHPRTRMLATVVRAPDGSCYVNTPGWHGTVSFDWDGYNALLSQQTQRQAAQQATVRYDRIEMQNLRRRQKEAS